MVKKEAGKKLGCKYCGSSFEAYPPDDIHDIASLKENDVGDPVKMTYRCKECHEENVIFWGYEQVYVGAV